MQLESSSHPSSSDVSTVHTVAVILNLNELMASVCFSFVFVSGLLFSVSPEWLFDRSVPANGSHHVLQTNLEQLHGARLSVSLYEAFLKTLSLSPSAVITGDWHCRPSLLSHIISSVRV